MKRAWVTVGVIAAAFLALLVTLRVVADRLHEQAMVVALLPEPVAVERYEKLKALPPDAERLPDAPVPAVRQVLSDAAAVDMHAQWLERFDRELYLDDAWWELKEFLHGGVARPLDPATWEPVRAFIEESQGFLAQVREAAALGGPIYPLDLEKGWRTPLPHLKKVKEVTSLLRADAFYHAAHGDHDVFAADVVAILGLANALAEEPLQISQHYRSVAVHLAFDALRRGLRAGDLGPQRVTQLVSLAQTAAGREFFVQATHGDAMMFRQIFDEFRHDGAAAKEEYLDYREGSLVGQATNRVYASPFGIPWRSADERAFVEGMAALADASTLPYHQARPRLDALWKQVEALPSTRLFAPDFLASALDQSHRQAALEVKADLMRLGLAVEQHQAQTGRFPESLAAIEDVAGGLPLDPFTGQGYVYRTTNGAFVLYSLGRDGIDDGGLNRWSRGLGRDKDDIAWRSASVEREEEVMTSGSDGIALLRVYIGTYTDGASEGIYLAELHAQTGRLELIGLAGEAVNPSYLAFHPDLWVAYAVGETASEDGSSGGTVSALRVDTVSGRLTLLGTQPSMGGAPCHVAVAPGGRHVAVSNYTSGTVALFPVEADGSLGAASDWVQHASDTGPGRHPRAHSATFDGAGRLIVADLGLDTLFVYEYDAAQGALRPAVQPQVRLGDGLGPRHADFHPSGRFFHVVNEYGGSVSTFACDAATGRMDALDTVSTLPEGFSGSNSAAEIRVHPSGRFVYASNRGADSIAVFEVDAETGRLSAAGHTPAGGKTPRNFTLTPNGRYLLVANQHSDNVVVFRVEDGGRTLTPTGQSVDIPSPVCVAFVPVPGNR